MTQNYRLICLDNDDRADVSTQLRGVVHGIDRFLNLADCLAFIRDSSGRKEAFFLIVAGALAEKIVPEVQNQPHLHAIFIYPNATTPHDQWRKVAGAFTDVASLCQALQHAVRAYDECTSSISFFPPCPDGSVATLDRAFLYTLILKEIFLSTNFDHRHTSEFLWHIRALLADNPAQQQTINRFQTDYRPRNALHWHMHDGVLYSLLNYALRTMDLELLSTMGFFVRDVHEQIVAVQTQRHSNLSVFYRAHVFSQANFNRLTAAQGGWMSINNFSSANANREQSLDIARRAMAASDQIGVLFVITLDPSVPTEVFAFVNIEQSKEQVLFSMHATFHIDQIEQIDGERRLRQVKLTLASSNALVRHPIAEHLRQETDETTDSLRTAKLMIQAGQYTAAETIYKKLLDQTPDELQQSELLCQLGSVQYQQGQPAEALASFEKALLIRQKHLPPEHPQLAECFHHIGTVEGALPDLLKASEILETAVPPASLELATTYTSISLLHGKTGDYATALSFCEKALAIYERVLRGDDLRFAALYNDMGTLHVQTRNYEAACSFYIKSLEIRRRVLPSDHPDLACAYGHLGMTASLLNDHEAGVFLCQRALHQAESALPADHPQLHVYRSNLDYVKSQLQT